MLVMHLRMTQQTLQVESISHFCGIDCKLVQDPSHIVLQCLLSSRSKVPGADLAVLHRLAELHGRRLNKVLSIVLQTKESREAVQSNSHIEGIQVYTIHQQTRHHTIKTRGYVQEH